MLVRIDGAYGVNNISNDRRLCQDLEESLILAELVEDGASVDCSMDIILVLGRQLLNESVNHHGALLLKHSLHLPLFLG